MSNYTNGSRNSYSSGYRSRDRDRDRDRDRSSRNSRNYNSNRNRYYDRGSRNYSPPRRLVPEGGSPPRPVSIRSYRNSYDGPKPDYNSNRPPSPKGPEGYQGGESFYTPPESGNHPQPPPDPSGVAYYAGEHVVQGHPSGLYAPAQAPGYHPYGPEWNGGVGEQVPRKPKKPKKEKPDINGVVDGVIAQMKKKGIFDKFRRECLSEADSKPPYNNLHTRVTTTVDTFLRGLTWRPSFAKMNTRNQMRKRIEESPFFKPGIENIVEQCLRGKMGADFIPVIETETFGYMGCDGKNEEASNADASVKIENGTEDSLETKDQVNPHRDLEERVEEERPFQFIGTDYYPPPTGPFHIPPPPHSSFTLPPPPPPHIFNAPPPPPTISSPPPPPHEDPDTPPEPEEESLVPESSWNQSEEKDDEEMETCSYEDEAFIEEDEDSEDESPMFEKIGEVSPPRPVLLENSDDILRELQEEARRNAELLGKEDKKPPSELEPSPEFVQHDSPPILTDETAVNLDRVRDECKFLEPPPLFKEKLAYYKTLSGCGSVEPDK